MQPSADHLQPPSYSQSESFIFDFFWTHSSLLNSSVKEKHGGGGFPFPARPPASFSSCAASPQKNGEESEGSHGALVRST